MPDILKPYDPVATCPKCGHDDIDTAYVKYGGRYGMPCESWSQIAEREHLHRHCRRCHYEWCEAVLSQDKPDV